MTVAEPHPAPTDDLDGDLDGALGDLAAQLAGLGRQDLHDRVHAARVRLNRPNTVVCVVGEFKQGKSSLVNGLIGTDVCPVDDDIATSVITVVRYGESPDAVVRTRVDGQPGAERIPLDQIARYVTEAGADDRPHVERVDVSLPSGVLADGLALVDTPGMGGLGAGHAAATLAFLPFADGLVFVCDATRELTAAEVEFLGRARELCPTVLSVVTKVDVAPHWRRIVDIDRQRLAELGLDIGVVPVSSTLRHAALARRDRELNERSGYPDLLTQLQARVLAPAAAEAGHRARREALGVLDTVASGVDGELAALDDPAARDALATEAETTLARLEQLRGGGSRWNIVLGDRTTDLANAVTHRFRARLRDTTTRIEEQIETLKTAEQWDELARQLQTEVADAVTEAFIGVEDGRRALRDELAALLAADDVIAPGAHRTTRSVDVDGLWRARDLDPAESTAGKAARTGLTGLRGAQGGVMMLAIGSQFLPGAGAVFLASNPVLLGAGLLFGGHQLMEERKRRLAGRRQSARTQLRSFTDSVQFEVGNELSGQLREVQRELRDEFMALIGELQQTWTEAANAAKAALERTDAETTRRRQELTTRRQALAAIRGRLVEGAS
ncbi:MAG TPA: dynamin family protein [Acidimicrobiales bacterium]|nr:dynamin family protein [Acidimicrobiales bacterium]